MSLSKKTKVIYTVAVGMLILSMLCTFFVIPYLDSSGGLGQKQQDIVLIDEDTVMLHDAKLVQLNIFDPEGENDFLKPYSKGNYSFSVKNIARRSLRFMLTISDENEDKVPMVYRLKDTAGNYLCGSDTEWVPAAELRNIDGRVSSENQTKYYLDWKWETVADAEDTHLGATADDSKYILNFFVQATDVSSEIPAVFEQVFMNWICVVVAMTLVAAILAVSYFALRNHNNI